MLTIFQSVFCFRSKRRSSHPTPLSPVDEENGTAAASKKTPSRNAGPKLSLSCDAIRTAVKSLYNLDDFWLHKIGEGFFSEVFKVGRGTTNQNQAISISTPRH